MICGIDEAGRGPLAGPVCAAAVILGAGGEASSDNLPLDILNDSKKLTPSRRKELQCLICKEALAWGIGWASHTEIDSINILQASLLAMKRAYEDMFKRAGGLSGADSRANPVLSGENISVIVDGKFIPFINAPCTALVKADATVAQVMAASILAKTFRDSYMEEMALLYPQYGYEKHKGYPTKAHKEAILKYGPSPIQRLSFRV